MSEEIPAEWAYSSLKDFVKNENGSRKPISKTERLSIQGDFPYYGATGKIDNLNNFTHEGELVLVGEDGANLLTKARDLAFIVRGKFWVNNHAHALRCLSGVPSAFLSSYINSLDLSGYVTGSAQPKLTKANLERIPVPVPPLAEQKVIAAKLDELLAQVDSIKARLDAIPKILKRFRQSVLAAAVSGRLTEDWRGENETTDIMALVATVEQRKAGKLKVRLKKGWNEDITLSELPENWGWVNNHRLAEDKANAICAGPFGTIFKAKDFRSEGVPIIFLRHVKEFSFNQNKPNFMDRSVWKELHQEYSIFGGELLVTKLGDPPGEACIYPKHYGTAMVTPDVLKMNVDENIVDKKYLTYFFNSPVCKEIISDLAFGATRLRIDIAMFKGFPIPLPPKNEQAEIVSQVERLFIFTDLIEQRVQDAQARINNLTQSILAKAFRGELTAEWRKQNPDLISGENSAEALLERIRLERETAKPIKRKAKAKRKTRVA